MLQLKAIYILFGLPPKRYQNVYTFSGLVVETARLGGDLICRSENIISQEKVGQLILGG